MTSRRTWICAVAALTLVVASACGSDGDGGTDTTADIVTADTAMDAAGDIAMDVGTEDVPPPSNLDEVVPDLTLSFDELTDKVRIFRDEWGVPHVYAANEADAFFAQGFITAHDRLTQMYLMRMVILGRMSEFFFASAGDLTGDAYMRTINLHAVAEETWTALQSDPTAARSIAVMESFTAGVNAYIAALKDGSLPTPTDISVAGGAEVIETWTSVDTLMIGRLQSWDLSFDGFVDELDVYMDTMELKAVFDGSPLEGIVDDVFDFRPITDETVLAPPDVAKKAGAQRLRLSEIVEQPFYRRLPLSYLRQANERIRHLAAARRTPPGTERGSNNWAIAGEHTASGAAMLANDPHLSLRNPSVFYLNHVDTTRAGGDIELAGVSFPGIPGMILGRNANVAWAATVHAFDVTDLYVEELVPGTPEKVKFNGGEVAVNVREEVIHFHPADGDCDAKVEDWVKDSYDHTIEVDGELCTLTLQISEVPHHGPIIPGSRGTDGDGNPIALTWRWTGFEPSDDLVAVVGGYNFATNVQEVLTAAERFGVGAQNWVTADTEGNIGYAAYAKVPGRPHTTAEPILYPPFLPMPGTGEAEWDGWVPLEDLPHAYNPPEGYIRTANNDGWGVTLDGDPFNDGVAYQAFMFDIGFRGQRIASLMDAKLNAGGLTIADMQAIQGDHHSPLGELLTPIILSAVAAAEAEEAPAELAVFATDDVLAARDYLAGWDFMALNGVGDDVSAAERDSSIATTIFNVWLSMLIQNVLYDKGLEGLEDGLKGRLLVRMATAPETLATYDAGVGDTLLWDNQNTAEVIETRNVAVLTSLRVALDWLADTETVGPANAGGFGTDDMSAWRWGALHVIKLTHPLGEIGDIPPASVYPDGYPRPGDHFVVDACNTTMGGTYFGYNHGPAMRAAYEMAADGIGHECVIPGGEIARPGDKHYQDEMALWVQNEAHPILHTEDALLPSVEWSIELTPGE